MNAHEQIRQISVLIDRPPSEVYDFVSDPQNLPKWATGLGGSIENINGDWIADAPMGKIKIAFTPRNTFGVLDHDVTLLPAGVTFHNPMRVLPLGEGSAVIFTLIRHHGMTDEKFSQDAQWIAKDLDILKGLLER